MKDRLCFFIVIVTCFFSCRNTQNDNSGIIQVKKTSLAIDSKEISQISEIDSIYFEYSTKAMIDQDSTVWLMANIKKDHRIFGYQKPSNASNKMFLLSVFTNEVEGNPFDCFYGSYYQTQGLNEKGITLKYFSDTLDYRKVAILKNDTLVDYAYVENVWLEFEMDE